MDFEWWCGIVLILMWPTSITCTEWLGIYHLARWCIMLKWRVANGELNGDKWLANLIHGPLDYPNSPNQVRPSPFQIQIIRTVQTRLGPIPGLLDYLVYCQINYSCARPGLAWPISNLDWTGHTWRGSIMESGLGLARTLTRLGLAHPTRHTCKIKSIKEEKMGKLLGRVGTLWSFLI